MNFLLLSFTALLPFSVVISLSDIGTTPRTFAVVLTVSAAILILVLKYKRVELPRNRITLFAILFITLASFSVLYAYNRYEAIKELVPLASAFLLFVVTYTALRTSNSLAEKILKTMVLVSVPLSLIGVAQFMFGFDLIPQACGPAITFGNKNMASEFFVITFPIAVMLFIRERKPYWAVSALLAFLFIILGTSKGSLIAVSLEITVLNILLHKLWFKNQLKSRPVLISAAVSIITILLMFYASLSLAQKGNRAAVEKNGLIGAELNEYGSLGVRRDVWINSLVMIKDAPLIGRGWGNFIIHYPKYHQAIMKENRTGLDTEFDYAHNEILQSVVELGVVGALFLFGFIGSLTAVIDRLLKKRENLHEIIPITAVFIGIGFTSLVNFTLHLMTPLAYCAILLAILMRNEKPYAVSRMGQYTLFTAVLLAASVLTPLLIRKMESEYYMKMLKFSSADKQWVEAQRYGRLAVDAFPENRYTNWKLGIVSIYAQKTNEAEQNLIKALYMYPNSINLWFSLASAYDAAGKYPEAVETYRELLIRKPDLYQGLNNLGVVYAQMGKLDSAEIMFRKQIELCPDSASAHENIERLHGKEYKNDLR